ncbi:MAG: HNH endonuclease [Gemmatimonadales bacterium]
MHPPIDLYPQVLRSAALAYLESGLDAGRETLRPVAGETWSGARGPVPTFAPSAPAFSRRDGTPFFTPLQAVKILARDQFQCRYCGGETIPMPIAVLMHSLFPAELPFHERYRSGTVHPLFWTRVPELDHLKPGRLGNSPDDPLNFVTACIVCNTKKGDHLLEEVGWTLRIPTPGWDGMVPLYQQTWEHAGRPNAAYHGKWVKAFATARA